MVKVLNVVLDNRIGGIQNRILNIGKKLSEVEIIILAPIQEGDFSYVAKKEGFTVYQALIESPKFFASIRGLFKNLLWFIFFPLAVIHIIKIIKKEQIDIIHVNGLLSLQAVMAAKITNRPVVWHLISTIYPKELILIIRPIIKICAGKMIFVAENTIGYYLGINYPKEKIEIIHEPVDVRYFDAKKISEHEKIAIRTELDIPSDFRIIGFVGNINPQKKLEYFIESAKIVKTAFPKTKFLIVGTKIKEYKRYQENLDKLIRSYALDKDIIFLGKVHNLPKILSIVDIFLMTSISEGTPLVILEAMAMGIPVVAPDIGGISEQIVDGNTGIIVSQNHPEYISKAVIHLLEHSCERYRMGQNGRERTEKLFSLDICTEKHRRLYDFINKPR